jgi:hypothetical protein
MQTDRFGWLRSLAYLSLLLLGLCLGSHAQNTRVDGVVYRSSGFPAPGASISVCTQPATIGTSVAPCTPLAPLCLSATSSCSGGQPGGGDAPNPATSDGLGNYHFYIRPGKYSYQYYGSGLTTILNTDQTIPAALDTNNVFTGSNTFPTLNVSNAGVFTNTQQNSTLLSNVLGGGVAPTYHDLQASNGYSTDAVAGGIRCPAGGTVVQCNGIAGYARTFNSTGGNVGQSVGGYFTSECSANNARCWGANPVVADDNDITADWMIGVEIDFNSHNSGQNLVNGLLITGASTAIAAGSSAIGISGPDSVGTLHWGSGVAVGNGAASVGINVGSLTTGVSSASQPINFVNRSGSVNQTGAISTDSSGNFLIVPTGSGFSFIARPVINTDLTGAAMLYSRTAPTISSGFGTSPSILSSNGTATFRVNVGTGGVATTGVIAMPSASTGWNCQVSDLTTHSNFPQETASTTNSVTFGGFNSAGAATAWAASDTLTANCWGF